MSNAVGALDLAQLPQSWRDVVVPPQPVIRRVERVLHDSPKGVLRSDALAALVQRVAADHRIWQPLTITDPTRRRYRLAYEDEFLDLWVLSWMPGQMTGFHDHGASAVALTTVRGSVAERHLSIGSRPVERILVPGSVNVGDAGYIHAVGHHAGVPAVTIHAYSPPLVEVGQYRATTEGMLERELQHGRQELIDQTIDRQLAGERVTARPPDRAGARERNSAMPHGESRGAGSR